jgi:maltose O-acetyltransferase
MYLYKLIHKLKKGYYNFIYEQYRVKYAIDKTFRFNGERIVINGEGNVKLKEGSYLGAYSSISSNEGYIVEIGKNCAVSHNVRIYNNSYVTDQNFALMPRKLKFGNVIIGDNVWIGANVIILPNTVIGSNSVIGANSVVTGDIPPNSIASGIPCKVIREKKSVD